MSALHPAETSDLAPRELDARFRQPLMTYFLNRIGDRAEAEDLTQQTFLRLLRDDRSAVSNSRAFVFRVAANLLLDRARDRSRRGRDRSYSLDDETVVAFPLADPLNPERILLARDGVAQVVAALNDLGEVTRDIFMLFRFEHMRQKDIAHRLGMSQTAVEKQIMRATLHLLRKCGPV
jgi:RNA polymerase sigma factor (sigma-70 family)